MSENNLTSEKGQWYIMHVLTGQEEKVCLGIELVVKNSNLSNRVFETLVPKESVVRVRQNKKYVCKKKFFASYIFIRMIPDDGLFQFLKRIPSVTGFLGDGHPLPITKEEMQRILGLLDRSTESNPRTVVQFLFGESVRIKTGPFNHFIGKVEEINEEKTKLKVTVSIFGREAPVELDFSQVEKI